MGSVYRLEIRGVLEIDLDAYAAAALEEEDTTELLTDPDEILMEVSGHFPIEDAIPRWARNAIKFVSETHTTNPAPSHAQPPGQPECICRPTATGLSVTRSPHCPLHGDGA